MSMEEAQKMKFVKVTDKGIEKYEEKMKELKEQGATI
jgi:hypothetical protein